MGLLARDLVRLCSFVKEERSKTRDNGRSFVAVFDQPPRRYLAFRTLSAEGPSREWLGKLLSPGRHQVDFSTRCEVRTLKRGLGPGFVDCPDPLELSLDAITYVFEPAAQDPGVMYWGYLVRIVGFTMRLGSAVLEYDDSSNEVWSQDQAETQRCLAKRILGLMCGDE